MGPLVNDKVTRLDDGSPLRPFSENNEGDQPRSHKKSVAKIIAAIALFGGVVKQFLGTNADADQAPITSVAGSESSLSLVSINNDLTSAAPLQTVDQKTIGEVPASDSEVIRLLSTPLGRSQFMFDSSAGTQDIQLRATPAVPLNDNEALYAFKPGVGITLPSSDAGSGGLGRNGGGGGGGGKQKPPKQSSSDDRDDDDTTGSNSGGSNGGSSSEDPVADGDDDSDPAEDRLNQRPTVSNPVRMQPQYVNMSVLISATALLAGAHDADGDQLHVVNLSSSSGTLTPHGTDTWLYTPERGATDTVTFSYNVTDQALSVAQLATLEFIEAPPVKIVGTDGNDIIAGSPSADIIDALGGDDTVIGREGDDVIYGRSGNDRLVGGDGDDIIFGHEGNDQIFAGAGNDVVFGGAGDDLIHGDIGNDVLWGEDGDDTFIAAENDGNDVIDGGDGSDTYSAADTSTSIRVDLAAFSSSGQSTGNDTLISIENVVGSTGNDQIVGNDDSNTIDGFSGNDIVEGRGGADTLSGGNGNDTFVATIDDGDDGIFGGDGVDTLDFSEVTAPVHVDLTVGISLSSETGQDTFTDIENVIGSAGSDILVGNDTVNVIAGDDGADVINGGDGDDFLSGGNHNDTFVATIDDGDDDIDGGDGADSYDASASVADVVIDLGTGFASGDDIGTDTLQSVEEAIGGHGDDTLVASDAVNVLTGGNGQDVFVFESSNTGYGEGYRDKIMDFEVGDSINIKQLSTEAADTLDDLGFTKFVLISQGAEFTEPGQIRFRYDSFESQELTIIEGNIDDELSTHEFEIELIGHYELTDDDFYRERDSSGSG